MGARECGDQTSGKRATSRKLHNLGVCSEGPRRTLQYLGGGASPAKRNMRSMPPALQVCPPFGASISVRFSSPMIPLTLKPRFRSSHSSGAKAIARAVSRASSAARAFSSACGIRTVLATEMAADVDAARLQNGANRFSALGHGLQLVLGDRCDDMLVEAVGERKVGSDKINSELDQHSDEGDIARKSVDLRNQQCGAVNAASAKRLVDVRPLAISSALGFRVLGDQRPPPFRDESFDRRALSGKSEPSPLLHRRRDPEIGDQPAVEEREVERTRLKTRRRERSFKVGAAAASSAAAKVGSKCRQSVTSKTV